jgi:hypothetical protein
MVQPKPRVSSRDGTWNPDSFDFIIVKSSRPPCKTQQPKGQQRHPCPHGASAVIADQPRAFCPSTQLVVASNGSDRRMSFLLVGESEPMSMLPYHPSPPRGLMSSWQTSTASSTLIPTRNHSTRLHGRSLKLPHPSPAGPNTSRSLRRISVNTVDCFPRISERSWGFSHHGPGVLALGPVLFARLFIVTFGTEETDRAPATTPALTSSNKSC